MMTERNVLTRQQAESALDQIESKLATEGKSLNISTYMQAWGFDFSLIFDTFTWQLRRVSYHDPETGRTVSLGAPYMFNFVYRNGGLTAGIDFKVLFMFISGDLDIRQLDGAIFGRGIGLTVAPGAGADIQYLPGNNRGADLFVIAPQVGPAGGLRFPKMEFHKN